jgi:hypothetical protein
MKGWKRSLFWEGIPLLMFLGMFGLLSAVNWDYESKLLTPDQTAGDWSSVHLGQILLAIAAGQVVLASIILLIVRLIWPGVTSGTWLLVPLALVAMFLIFPSLFIVVLGPAAITMIQQERAAPR